MAKRQVPDFDRVAAFDQALAKQNPDLVTRLGGLATVPQEVAGVAEGNDGHATTEAEELSGKPEAVLKLVSSADSTTPRLSPRSVPSSKRRGVVDRANGRQLRRLTVYVDLELAQRLRKHCFEHELNLSEVAAEALAAGLEALIRRG